MKFWEWVDYGAGKSWLNFWSDLEHTLDMVSLTPAPVLLMGFA